MFSTPEVTHLTTPKISPFGSGINKNLLTPCRQVGLSRKRKKQSSLKTHSKKLNSSLNNCAIAETTPIIPKTSFRRTPTLKSEHLVPVIENGLRLEKTRKTSVSEENGIIKKQKVDVPKKKLLQSFQSQDLFNTDDLNLINSKTVKRILSEDDENYVQNKATGKLSPNNLNGNKKESIDVDNANPSKNKCPEYNDSDEGNFIVKHKVKRVLSSDEESAVSELTPNNLRESTCEYLINRNISTCVKRDAEKPVVETKTTLPRKLILQVSNKEDLTSNHQTRDENNMQINTYLTITSPKIHDKTLRQSLSRKRSSKFISHKNAYIEFDDSDDDFVISNSNRKQKKEKKNKLKQLKKTLSLKNSISDDDFEKDSVIPSKQLKECEVKLLRLSEEDINFQEPTLMSEVSKEQFKESSVICKDEDDDAFTSTPDREKSEKKDLGQKISSLEAQIKEKKRKLGDLKQASVYKNKHNVDDLKEVTSKWSKGCVLVLNDLLKRLQAHGLLDMATLISNLKIPKEIFTRLPINNVQ